MIEVEVPYQGVIFKVRVGICRGCGKPFVVQRRDKEYCSNSCANSSCAKRRYWRNPEKARARARLNDAKYRQNHKPRPVRAEVKLLSAIFRNDGGIGSVEEDIDHELLKKTIDDVFQVLRSREQRVLRLRFGLEDGRSQTLKEVGQEFNVTAERIRQVEAKALRKLRDPQVASKLRGFIR